MKFRTHNLLDCLITIMELQSRVEQRAESRAEQRRTQHSRGEQHSHLLNPIPPAATQPVLAPH
eukprot:SAG31_NODE_13007_length_900_cov_1.078652_2_plen_62_part_01